MRPLLIGHIMVIGSCTLIIRAYEAKPTDIVDYIATVIMILFPYAFPHAQSSVACAFVGKPFMTWPGPISHLSHHVWVTHFHQAVVCVIGIPGQPFLGLLADAVRIAVMAMRLPTRGASPVPMVMVAC